LHEKVVDHYEFNVEKQYAMEPENRLTWNTVALPEGEGNACPFSLREKVGMREGTPAKGIPAGMGGKPAQSGEKGDEASLREFHVNATPLVPVQPQMA
jgi:hypothetical protein